MSEPKKLIEVAIPIKEISAECVRDKSIRHGHISTLHMWWARRPLPICRAVVFASLVPDPLDENCPKQFKEAVAFLLGNSKNFGDPYKPYNDIPWTSIYDPMEDNLRNRLQMFIGKFTDEMQSFLLNRRPKPNSNNQISDSSLIKWDNKNNIEVINLARKLIWVSFNCKSNPNKSSEELLTDFDDHYNLIKKSEEHLYSLTDRHIKTNEVIKAEENLRHAITNFQQKMPVVFDPFAGGGAIPLEAARLGCRSFGNDINPVAHIIQKGSLEYPQKFGKPIIYSKSEFINRYGIDEWIIQTNDNLIFENGESTAVRIPNRLSFDVTFYSRKLLKETEKIIGHLYPKNKLGERPIAYYWARVGNCTNPTCRAEIPLLRRFALCDLPNKKVFLNPIIEKNSIDFEIVNRKVEGGWLLKSLICPCCGATTSTADLKSQAATNQIKHRLIAVIEDSKNGKIYRKADQEEIEAAKIDTTLLNPLFTPNEEMKAIPDLVSGRGWNINKWSEMFSDRQLYALQSLIENFNAFKSNFEKSEYSEGILVYMAIFIDRIVQRQTSFGIWDVTRENLQAIFARQSIAMMFDYPESNLFSNFGGGAISQLDWINRYIESECSVPFSTNLKNASSGEKEQFKEKEVYAVITDPPYYDAIAYADLSDFFYVWLKRTLGDVLPLNFATPQTPKTEECTALKHNHNGNKEDAKNHFENKLLQIFDALEHQTSDIVSIMFAHQSTEAWSTLCNSILGARMNITGSWALDTEYNFTGLKQGKSFLASSVTVSAKPSLQKGIANFKEIKKSIESTVSHEVEKLYRLGFRGADLLTACFGQAVSEFGKYEKVEKADGSDVSVSELLELARESAFNALLKGFKGDDYSKFYIGWLQLNSFSVSNYDDAVRFTRVGLNIEIQDIFKERILIQNGDKQSLATMSDRIQNIKLGDLRTSSLIDKAHKAMFLYSANNRILLLKYILENYSDPENSEWRVLTSLAELLPKDMLDHKLAIGLLTNKDQLIRESKSLNTHKPEQSQLTFE
jgi:putative DNA methylase